MKKIAVLCLAMFLTAAMCSLASADPIKMKISMGDPDSHFNLVMMREMLKPQIEKESNGQIVVEVYAGGVLGGYRESIEGCQMGSIEMAQVNAAALTGFSKKFMCVGLPYAFSNKKTFYEAYNGKVGEMIFAELPKQGLMGVGYLDNGMRSVTNNRKPIVKPEDVAGLKIRVLESPINIATWKLLGANPTPVSYGELYTALQQGTVDAQDNSAVIINENKIQQVQKYYSLTRHQSDTDILIMRKSFYDKLSPELQEVVMQAIKDYCAAQQARYLEEEEKAMQKLREDGMEINDLTPEQIQVWKNAVKPIYDQFRDEIGPELVDLILSYENQ